MKRRLEGKELDISKRQLKRRKDDLQAISKNLEYNEDLIKRQAFIQSHDDKWRPFLREQKEYEDKKVLKNIKNELELVKETIGVLNDQINNGVENLSHTD